MRAAFHDSGTFNAAAGTGRPNGCFLRDDPANGGLAPILVTLGQA